MLRFQGSKDSQNSQMRLQQTKILTCNDRGLLDWKKWETTPNKCRIEWALGVGRGVYRTCNVGLEYRCDIIHHTYRSL